VPDTVEVEVGAIVRIPLGGRRVRGWVVATGVPHRAGLRRLLGRSGDLAVFDARLLQTLRWAAAHYVAPLATLLAKSAPPNLPKRRAAPRFADLPHAGASPLPDVTEACAAGGRVRAHAVVGDLGDPDALAALTGPVLASGRSAMVVAPTVVEAEALATALGARLPGRVLVGGSNRAAADVTRDWSLAAAHPGHLVVGTREVCFWPVSALGLAVVVGEGRRGMKDKATPTTHAVDVLSRRAGVERFSLVTADLVPTATTIARGPVTVSGPGARPWGLVEIVDRNDDPPGSGLTSDRTRQAISAVVRGGGRVFLFAARRGGAARCVRCRTLRTCGACGARPGTGDACPRCGAGVGPCASCGARRFEGLGAGVGRITSEVAGFIGGDAVGEPGSGRSVAVGTERDLAGLAPVDLSVIVDADGPMLAPHYRASEDALRMFARVVALAGRGRGRRAIVQTAMPESPVIEAIRRAEPLAFLEREVAVRSDLGFPPSGELLAIEVRDALDGADADLREALGDRATVLGPSEHDGELRWLIQGRDLGPARIVLRSLVHRWREAGVRVRVDADPIDL
jgi:primosomal protein N' (replication factor Y)